MRARHGGHGDGYDAFGASDIEAGFNTAYWTEQWADSYARATTTPYYNYGDCAGCPTGVSYANSAAKPGYSLDRGWHQDDVYYLSWRNPDARPLPELYDPPNQPVNPADAWEDIALYGVHNYPPDPSKKQPLMRFAGALSEYTQCQLHRDPTCDGTDARPELGWTELWCALNYADSRLTPYASS